MNPDQEDFGQLRQLLALKRHEQPPPGYFEGFSRQVILRIQAQEQAEPEGFLARFLWDARWARRFWAQFGVRPALAGALGLAVCGLFMAGLASSGNDPAEATAGLLPQPIPGSFHVASWTPSDPVLTRATVAEVIPTNGAVLGLEGGSLFEQFRKLQQQPQWRGDMEPVLFSLPGGN